MPELLVHSPPFSDRCVALALTEGVCEVYVGNPEHPHGGGLDHRDPVPLRIDYCLAQPWLRKRVTFMLVVSDKPVVVVLVPSRTAATS